jgi:hypothetical protein
VTQPQPPPPGQPPPAAQQQQLALAAATVLATAATAAAAASVLAPVFAAWGVRRRVTEAELEIIFGMPPEKAGFYGPAGANIARVNLMRRAMFLVAGIFRLNGDDSLMRAGAEAGLWTYALARERRFYGQQLVAGWGRAKAAAQVDSASMLYGTYLGWHTVRDSRTSPECLAADGRNFWSYRMPRIGYPGTVHPHCFPPGTKINSPSVLADSSRWYSGEFIEIVTVDGHRLAVTPNHPVLTAQGWVAAGLLDEGSYVVRALDPGAAAAAGDPDDHEVVALIEDVPVAAGGTGCVTPAAVPVSAVDFHGDGIEHQVAVVRSYRELVDWAEVGQPGGVEQFPGAAGRSALPTPGDLRPVLGGLLPAAHGGVGGLGIARVLLGGPAGGHDPVGFGVAPEPDAGVQQDAGHPAPAAPARLGERIHRLAGLVTLDKIVHAHRFHDSAPVYNLQTSAGWYIANSIIVHNCRCLPGSPFPSGGLVDAASVWRRGSTGTRRPAVPVH